MIVVNRRESAAHLLLILRKDYGSLDIYVTRNFTFDWEVLSSPQNSLHLDDGFFTIDMILFSSPMEELAFVVQTRNGHSFRRSFSHGNFDR
jgi:hypothetical protein